MREQRLIGVNKSKEVGSGLGIHGAEQKTSNFCAIARNEVFFGFGLNLLLKQKAVCVVVLTFIVMILGNQFNLLQPHRPRAHR